MEVSAVAAAVQAKWLSCSFPYKIKLRTLGYRLVHQVRDDEMAVIVIAVDKRDRLAAYKAAVTRLSK